MISTYCRSIASSGEVPECSPTFKSNCDKNLMVLLYLSVVVVYKILILVSASDITLPFKQFQVFRATETVKNSTVNSLMRRLLTVLQMFDNILTLTSNIFLKFSDCIVLQFSYHVKPIIESLLII